MTTGGSGGPGGVGPGAGVLIIGYGNTLRSDDGLGWHVVARLADDPRISGAELVARHQLSPELAVDVVRATLVILIDAAVDVEPGVVAVRQLAVGPAPDATLMSHHVDPASLVALAAELYSAAPAVYLVSMGAASLEVGDQLTPEVERAIPELLEAVIGIALQHQRPR